MKPVQVDEVTRALCFKGFHPSIWMHSSKRSYPSHGFDVLEIRKRIFLWYTISWEDPLSAHEVGQTPRTRHLELLAIATALHSLDFKLAAYMHPKWKQWLSHLEILGRTLITPKSTSDLIIGRKVELSGASWSGYQPIIVGIDGSIVRIALNSRSYLVDFDKILYMLPEDY